VNQLVTRGTLYEHLLRAVPEVRVDYEELLQLYDPGEDPGGHVVIGDVLVPFLRARLKEGTEDELRRAFGFIEGMARSTDDDVVNIVYVSICEPLGGDRDLLKRARAYMGPRTLTISGEVEAWWRRFLTWLRRR